MKHEKQFNGPSERPKSTRGTIRRLFRYLGLWKPLFFSLLAVTLLSIALDIVMPLLIEGCIDAIGFTGGLAPDMERFIAYLIALIGLFLLNALFGYLHGMLSARLSLNMEARFREEAFEKIVRMPLREGERWRTGDLMSRVMNDSHLAANAFSDAILSLLSSIVVIAGCAAVMFWKFAPLAAISVSATVVSVFALGAVSKFLFPAFMAQQTSLGFLNTHVEESLHGFRSCTAGNRMGENERLMEAYSSDYYRKCVRASKLEGLLEPLMLFLGNVNFLLVVIFGARSIISGTISLGTMQAFILYSKQFMEPVSELGECFAQVQNSLAGAERVFELLDSPDEAADALPGRADSTARAPEDVFLRYEGVRFSYRRNVPVLRDVDLCIRKGERIALVGATGAGKTTLASLLPRLYDGYGGTIFLEGEDTRQIPLAALRRRITLVSQEPQLIDGSIYDNIAYGMEEPSKERVYGSAEAVGLAGMIEKLPRKYDTPVANGGEGLSQGQLQLICLARALARDAEVLILDEATSSVDAATEAALKRGLKAAMAGRTCITIAHRIASVVDADRICVVHDGVIAEYGTHTELLAARGAYYTLFQTQFLGIET